MGCRVGDADRGQSVILSLQVTASGALIEPLQRGAAFLADVRAAPASRASMHVWWLGQSGFLLAFDGEHLALDPYLSDSLTRKYAATPTPHVRMTRQVVAPQALDFLSAVTASHHHTDHLDPDTLRPILAASPRARLVVPTSHRELARSRSAIEPTRVRTIDAGETVRVGRFRIRAVPAAHETIERDDDGHLGFLGYVVEAGPFRLYHAGDTIPYPALVSTVGAVDVALLPINGRDPRRGVPGNLTAREAAQIAAALPAGVAVPCHYDMFAFNTASPEPFVAHCRAHGVTAQVLRAGERLTIGAAADHQ